jgi:hypothetical protein
LSALTDVIQDWSFSESLHSCRISNIFHHHSVIHFMSLSPRSKSYPIW